MENTHLDAEFGNQKSYASTDYQEYSHQLSLSGDKLTDNPKKDSHMRSLIKGITYRTVSTLATVAITYFVLGDVSVAFEIGFVDFFCKLMIYYLHERAWSYVKFL